MWNRKAFPMARVSWWKTMAGAAMVFLIPAALYGADITITKIQDLTFGFCDATPSATYTVLPAASPGLGACQGATAARFDITGDPNRKAKITLGNNVIITNSVESLTVTLTDTAGGPQLCLGTGTITFWVGGSTTIPAGGLTTNGVFTLPTTLELKYVGGSC
jgi:hypothetical protein